MKYDSGSTRVRDSFIVSALILTGLVAFLWVRDWIDQRLALKAIAACDHTKPITSRDQAIGYARELFSNDDRVPEIYRDPKVVYAASEEGSPSNWRAERYEEGRYYTVFFTVRTKRPVSRNTFSLTYKYMISHEGCHVLYQNDSLGRKEADYGLMDPLAPPTNR